MEPTPKEMPSVDATPLNSTQKRLSEICPSLAAAASEMQFWDTAAVLYMKLRKIFSPSAAPVTVMWPVSATAGALNSLSEIDTSVTAPATVMMVVGTDAASPRNLLPLMSVRRAVAAMVMTFDGAMAVVETTNSHAVIDTSVPVMLMGNTTPLIPIGLMRMPAICTSLTAMAHWLVVCVHVNVGIAVPRPTPIMRVPATSAAENVVASATFST